MSLIPSSIDMNTPMKFSLSSSITTHLLSRSEKAEILVYTFPDSEGPGYLRFKLIQVNIQGFDPKKLQQ